MEGLAEDGMKGVEVLRGRGLPSKVLDQVTFLGHKVLIQCQSLWLSGLSLSYKCLSKVIVFLFLKKVEDWVWAVWDNSEPDREDSAAEVCFIKF